MASTNEQGQFGIPTMGVRKDVAELVSTSDMAVDASNVLVYDSTVRPRPALTREGFGADASSWEDVDIKGSIEMNIECVQLIGDDLVAIVNNDKNNSRWIRYSTDNGLTWNDDVTSTLPPYHPQRKAVKMIVTGGRILLFENWDHYTQTGGVYTAPVVSYPGNPLVFTLLFGGGALFPGFYPPSEFTICPKDPQKYKYDATLDVLIVQREYQLGGFWNVPPIDPSIGNIPASSLHSEDGQFQYYPSVSTINDYANIGQFRLNMSYKTYSYGGFRAKLLGFQGGLVWFHEYYEFWSNPNGRAEFGTNELTRNQNKLRGYLPADLSDPDIPATPTREAHLVNIGDRMTVETKAPAAVYEKDADTIWMLWNNGLQEIDLTDTSVSWFDQPYTVGPEPDARLDVSNEGDGTLSMFTGMAESFTRTSGGVITEWEDFNGDAAVNKVAELIFDTTVGDGAWFMSVQNQWPWVWDGRQPILDTTFWLVPGGSAPPGFGTASIAGDVTSIYQADLDDDENAVLVGTTTKINKLNRGTKRWESVTGDALTSPDSPDTNLGGVWGESPVIFKVVESGSNRGVPRTYLLATNGVDRPLVWNEDLPNGKCRFMGEILEDSDPNYIADDEYPNGVNAPISRTLAVASNRVLLGNLPAVSGFAIDVSSFNDMDRGWGRVQRTLVGDTPGHIVSMNEISALQVAVYKTDAIYSAVAQVDFYGGQAPFRFELVKAGVPGPCSPMSVLRMHDGNQVFLGRDGGVYIYDGVAPRDVGRNVRQMIQPFLDNNEYGKAWGMVDNSRKLLWFFYPTKSRNINRGVVMSTDQGLPYPVWPVQMPAGWQMTAGTRAFFVTDTAIGELQDSLVSQDPKRLGDYSTGREEMVIGRINNSWYTQKWEDDGNYTDDGIPIDIKLTTGWNPFGAMIQFKTVHELYHIFEASGDGLVVNIAMAAHQADTTSLISGPQVLSNTVPSLRTDHRATGTRFAIQMKGSINRMFRWGGATATYAQRGMR